MFLNFILDLSSRDYLYVSKLIRHTDDSQHNQNLSNFISIDNSIL